MTVVKICGLTNLDDALFAAQQGAELLGFIFAPVSKRYITPKEAQPIVQAIHQQTQARCIGVFVVTDEVDAVQINQACQISGVDAAQVVGENLDNIVPLLQKPAYITIRPSSTVEAQLEATIYERLENPPYLPTLQLDAFHPDLYGGTGQTATLEIAKAVAQQTQRLMLSGGLTAENVAEYVTAIRPFAVDVASGTEAKPRYKDPEKVKRFIQAAKSVQ